VQADDAARVLRRDRELGDRQARGVGREDRVRRADRVELAEDLALEVEVLGHRLDRRGPRREPVQVGDDLDAAEQRGTLVLGELAAGDARSVDASTTPRACAAASADTSTPITSPPDRANTSAMPAPWSPDRPHRPCGCRAS
jgi:hypothetical protein